MTRERDAVGTWRERYIHAGITRRPRRYVLVLRKVWCGTTNRGDLHAQPMTTVHVGVRIVLPREMEIGKSQKHAKNGNGNHQWDLGNLFI